MENGNSKVKGTVAHIVSGPFWTISNIVTLNATPSPSYRMRYGKIVEMHNRCNLSCTMSSIRAPGGGGKVLGNRALAPRR
eukprot:7420094-Pyramimonas_sp.AAC.1